MTTEPPLQNLFDFTARDRPVDTATETVKPAPPSERVDVDPTALRHLTLELELDDPETIDELLRVENPRERQALARVALRIGVLALRQARGQVDETRLRDEGRRLVTALDDHLERHRQALTEELTGRLRDYFDPDDGRFNERVDRLVRRDGELEQLLRRHVGERESELGRTLDARLGADSPLLRWLSPDQSEGLLAAVSGSLETQLERQREQLMREFSLDHKEGALARLVAEVDQRQSSLSEEFRGQLKGITEEFSLDHETSALSRLVQRVEQAQRRISDEFSLDTDDSALARLRREVVGVLREQVDQNARFRDEVGRALADLQARREEVDRSTRRGDAFEDELFRLIESDARQHGDIAENTGRLVGRIKNCKVGDAVVQLSPDSAASGARVVIEAKDRARTSLPAALEEAETARKNRDAQVSLFVYSRPHAPGELESLQRYGDDIVVVWDVDDPSSDLVVRAALSLARALCTRAVQPGHDDGADWEALDRAVRSVEKQARQLDEIRQAGGTIQTAAARILDRVRLLRETLDREVATVDEQLARLRQD